MAAAEDDFVAVSIGAKDIFVSTRIDEYFVVCCEGFGGVLVARSDTPDAGAEMVEERDLKDRFVGEGVGDIFDASLLEELRGEEKGIWADEACVVVTHKESCSVRNSVKATVLVAEIAMGHSREELVDIFDELFIAVVEAVDVIGQEALAQAAPEDTTFGWTLWRR